MSAAANHILHVRVGWGSTVLRLECIEGTPGHHSFTERRWPDDASCHCDDRECPCREGDHGGCGNFGVHIETMGYECRLDRDESTCWVHDWLDESGDDCLADGEWPEDGPWPVRCVFDGDWLRIEYAPDRSDG